MPIFAAIVLWFRRESFPADRIGPNWLGVPLLLLAAGMRLAGSVFAFEWLEAGSLVPAVAGVVLLTFGWAVTRWANWVRLLLDVAGPTHLRNLRSDFRHLGRALDRQCHSGGGASLPAV